MATVLPFQLRPVANATSRTFANWLPREDRRNDHLGRLANLAGLMIPSRFCERGQSSLAMAQPKHSVAGVAGPLAVLARRDGRHGAEAPQAGSVPQNVGQSEGEGEAEQHTAGCFRGG